MSSKDKKIEFFISYRRSDKVSKPTANWFKNMLDKRFKYTGNVFLDDENVSKTEELFTQIEKAINSCDVMFIIIGPNWRKGEFGEDSIEDTRDWVHREIQLALKRKDKIKIFVIHMNSDEWTTERIYPSKFMFLNKKVPIRLKHNELTEHNTELSGLSRELDEIADKYKRKPIAFVTSTLTYTGNPDSIDGLDYFTTLLSCMIKEVGKFDYNVVVKVPEFSEKNYPARVKDNQIAEIKKILDNPNFYKGLIIAPYQVEPVVESIKIFRKEQRKFNDFPIAFIDKGFKESEISNLNAVFSVENDGVHNGKEAAQCLIKYLSKAKLLEVDIEKCNVVIMQGRESSEERIKGFTQYIDNQKDKMKIDIEYFITTPMDFIKEVAINKTLRYLKSSWIRNKFKDRPEQIHAFFCSNDEIALGVNIALEKTISYKEYEHPVVIIGYDAIRDFTVLLKLKESKFVLNTINVRLNEQVETLVKQFFNFIENKSINEKRVISIPGKPYLDEEDQEDRVEEIVHEYKKMKDQKTEKKRRLD